MSKLKPRVDTTQAPAKEEAKKEEAPAADTDKADKNDGPGEMDVD